MPKAIKISPNKIEELDEWRKDEEYINTVISGYALLLPEFWQYKKYKLTVFVLDRVDESHVFNPLATHLYRSLRSKYEPVEDTIFGLMYIVNENENETIDFTMKDLTYILNKCKNIQYEKRDKEKETQFLKWLEDISV